MDEQSRVNYEPHDRSRSTLLIPMVYYRRYFWRSPCIKIGDWPLAVYLSALMSDPQLEYKLRFLRSGKWKKQYQAEGQNLVRVNFYPDDRDWGRLSAISHATGFSRCYIFVFLMLIALGEISLDYGGTPLSRKEGHWNPVIICLISVDCVSKKLTRILQT
jgi:hypothetical protein